MNPIELIMAFTGAFSFAALLNSPKNELVFCGLTGLVCWTFYNIVIQFAGDSYTVAASFTAALAVTVVSRCLSYIRKAPSTIFLLGGIIPIVPGAGVYYTMANIISDNNIEAFATGIETLKIAGVIALGILIVLSLPAKLFRIPFFNSN